MKKNNLFIFLGLFLLLLGGFYSCQKQSDDLETTADAGIKPIDPEVVRKAKTWHAENMTYTKEKGMQDLDINRLVFDWDKFALATNKSGQQILTVPIRSTASKAKYIELGFVLDQQGKGNGMIKEYMGDPYAGEITLNLYTGIGKRFESGLYHAATKVEISEAVVLPHFWWPRRSIYYTFPQ